MSLTKRSFGKEKTGTFEVTEYVLENIEQIKAFFEKYL